MDFESVRVYWAGSRRARGLSLKKLAERLEEQMGFPVNYHQLANWEYKGTQPKEGLGQAIKWQIQAWQAEDCAEAYRAKEQRDRYGGLIFCESCSSEVPGPGLGADYCMLCGTYFRRRVCAECGFLELRQAAEFCVKCGTRFEKGSSDEKV